ncbi:hypothetical protein Tco_0435861 [Tanacetum coccineum]
MKEMLRTCYRHGLTKGETIQLYYHGLDDPTQGILNAGGIFLYNTPNKAFKILEDKVHLKLDFSDDSQNRPKLKTIVSAGGSNINDDHTILMEKFEALATKINFEFLIFFFSVTLIASSSSKSSSTKGDVLEGGGVSSNVTLNDSSIFMVKLSEVSMMEIRLKEVASKRP